MAVINGNITMDRIMPAQWPGPDTQLTYQWSEPGSEGGGEVGRVRECKESMESLRDGWRRLSRVTPQYLAHTDNNLGLS